MHMIEPRVKVPGKRRVLPYIAHALRASCKNPCHPSNAHAMVPSVPVISLLPLPVLPESRRATVVAPGLFSTTGAARNLVSFCGHIIYFSLLFCTVSTETYGRLQSGQVTRLEFSPRILGCLTDWTVWVVYGVITDEGVLVVNRTICDPEFRKHG